jgi:hypothetical protein
MNNAYAYTGTYSTSSITSAASKLCPVVILAGIASTDYQPSDIPSPPPAKVVKYSPDVEASETVNPNYYVDSLLMIDQLEQSYLENILEKLSSAQESGFVEIPKNLETEDDFFAWLHR